MRILYNSPQILFFSTFEIRQLRSPHHTDSPISFVQMESLTENPPANDIAVVRENICLDLSGVKKLAYIISKSQIQDFFFFFHLKNTGCRISKNKEKKKYTRNYRHVVGLLLTEAAYCLLMAFQYKRRVESGACRYVLYLHWKKAASFMLERTQTWSKPCIRTHTLRFQKVSAGPTGKKNKKKTLQVINIQGTHSLFSLVLVTKFFLIFLSLFVKKTKNKKQKIKTRMLTKKEVAVQ